MAFGQSPNTDRFISLFFGPILGLLLFMLQVNGVLVRWVTSLALYVLILAAAVIVLWMYGIPTGTGIANKWITTLCTAGLLAGLGSVGTYKQYRHEHPSETTHAPGLQNQMLALATLTQQGWKREVENGTEYFELDRQPLPDMAEATSAFNALKRPIALRLQSVPSLKGLHLLGEAHVCHDLTILASNLNTLDELATFTDLTKLRISQTPFDNGAYLNAEAIGKLTELKELFLNAVRLQSADFIPKLTKLEKLDLTATPIRDKDVVKDLRSLTSLSLANSYITELSWLPELTNLKELSVGEPEIPALTAITAPLHLKKLSIISYHRVDTRRLPIDENLEEIYLYGETLNLSGLRKTPRLRTVYLQSLDALRLGHLESAETLGKLAALQGLTISAYDIKDIGFIKTCRSLKQVTLFSDPVESIDVLGDLPQLEDVKISRLPIQDASALLRAVYLKSAMIVGTRIPIDQIDELQSRGVHLVR
jgi:hypothetical protein